MFDCWTLIQEMNDFGTVASVYDKVSRIEMGYRKLEKHPEDCLLDTIQSCICILGRGSINEEEYKLFADGIGSIQNHIFKGKIYGENAGVYASEVMYLATCLLTKQKELVKISSPEEYRNSGLKIQGIKKVSSLKNTNPHAYAYMMRAFEMLQGVGLYKNSVFEA